MNSRNTARDQLIVTAIEHLSRRGPAGIQPQEICRELGMSKALVNYHFGNREGLIAEAMVVGYEDYVAELMVAADAAGDDPVERLLAWVNRQVEWTTEHRGLAAALDFPDVAVTQPDIGLHTELQQRLSAAGRRNFANLQLLVLDARNHLKRDEPGYVADATEVGLTAAAIGWMTLGLSVWLGGKHLPTQDAGMHQFLPLARSHVRTLMIEMLSR